jgi:hypothetical protein
MLATPGNVYQVLDGNRQYVIPVYQRTYSWQREQCEQCEQCEQLWKDIVKMQKSNRAGHFVGSIVNVTEQAINMRFGEVSDPSGICRDITGLGRWGNGDVELFFGSLAELEDVMFIIEQSFRKQTESEVG